MINNYLDSLWTEASQDIPDRFFLIVKIPAATDNISFLTKSGRARKAGGRRGLLNKVFKGRLRLVVQPLTLLYNIFGRKGTPFMYLLRKVTILVCEQKPYPVRFSCRRKSYPV